LFQEAPIGIGLENLDGRLLFASPLLSTMLGYTAEEIRGLNNLQLMDPADHEEHRKLFHDMHAGVLEGYQREVRLLRKDGTPIWARFSASLLKGYTIDLPLVIVMIADITEQKAAEKQLRAAQDELQQLTIRLLQAQEDERQRIARDLHDDIEQRLSLLRVEMGLFAQELSPTLQKEHFRLADLLIEMDELAADIHNLSHQLHSAKLKNLGLLPALRDLCGQASRQHHVEVELSAEENVSPLPEEVDLCLFRVAQEALKNAIKHSGSARIFIAVKAVADAIRMDIRDFGIGFDPSTISQGLGLASMRERLRMVGGELILQSAPGKGTQLVALVPHRSIEQARIVGAAE
jgi:PAS domain S-box-containing protein